MLKFTREERRVVSYSDIPLAEFMDRYYAGTMVDNCDSNNLLIYVHGKIGNGGMSYAFEVPCPKGVDLYDDKVVEELIQKAIDEDKVRYC